MSRSATMAGQRDVLVLCYHAVSRSWPVGLAVRPADLDRQVSSLLEKGYTPATFVEAVTKPPLGKTLAVTFDDAFRSVFEEGLPVLARLGVPATVFSWTAYVEAREAGAEHPPGGPVMQAWFGTRHEHELHSMSWNELREVTAAGWEVGSHTMSHPYLTQVDDAALHWELEASRARLEQELGVPCRTLAYPSGDFDERVVQAAGRAGYEAACTLPIRFPAHPDPLAWPRISIQRDDSFATFRLKVAPATRRLRKTAIWPAFEAARGLGGRVRRKLG